MKINILYKLKAGGWGGGNTFLRALREEFLKMGVYEEDPSMAEAILFNSFPFREEYRFRQIAKLKKAGKIIIHRVDGPISEIRGGDLIVDKIIYSFNNLFADGTIFQSNWSREENYRLGMGKKQFEAVISNASNPDIFNQIGKTAFNKKKVKLIATPWSSNFKKGFALYKYLDENLDFSRYEMSFFGHSPVDFKNIINHEAVDTVQLSEELKKHDIFITPSQKDPCSNSLIEALNCGLPAVCLNDGGHPEIVKGAGEFFSGEGDILEKIEKVADNYEYYQAQIQIPSIKKIAEDYYDFVKDVYGAFSEGKLKSRKIKIFSFYKMLAMVYFRKISGLLQGAIKKILK